MTTASSTRPFEVLLVEDDPGDVAMTREALSAATAPVRLSVVSDGDEAVAFLKRSAPHQDAVRPDLVLLDLNLPRLSGHEVLAQVKSDEELRCIPVVVLTTSRAEDDVARSYQLNANAYVAKPMGYAQFHEAVRKVDEFFLSVVELPPKEMGPGPGAGPRSRRPPEH